MVQEREALTPGSNCPYHTIASMMGVVDKPSVTQDSGLRTQDSGLRTQDSGLRTQDSGLRTQDSVTQSLSYWIFKWPIRCAS
jgi:hypothetical protein